MMDLISYPDYSKVWIYAASDKIQDADILETYSKFWILPKLGQATILPYVQLVDYYITDL